MIRLCSTSNININNFDEIWVVCRSISKLASRLKDNPKTIHVPELSPEPELFYAYVRWKNAGNWSEELFQTNYVPEFIREIQNNKDAIKRLDELCEKSKTKNIALVCFCSDEKMCHRSILAGILSNKGANIVCNSYYKKYRFK